jgi:prepilin-type processing-associated H-X9-DG protein
MPRTRWTLLDLLVSAAVLLLLSAYAVSQVANNRETRNRIRCASNLHTLGQALFLYANENRNAFPRTLFDPAHPAPTWGTPYRDHPDLGPIEGADPFARDDSPAAKTRPAANDVTAPLYLLMRTEPITSPVFVCPSSGATFDDFGGGKYNALHWTNFKGDAGIRDHLSYSFANPYPSPDAAKAGFKFDNALPPDFVVVADINPGGRNVMRVTPISPPDIMRRTNSPNHGREGQNVLYGDGHVTWVTSPFVGINHDNIYTYGPSADKPGTGVVGSPTDPADSVLLPTAADVAATETRPDHARQD